MLQDGVGVGVDTALQDGVGVCVYVGVGVGVELVLVLFESDVVDRELDVPELVGTLVNDDELDIEAYEKLVGNMEHVADILGSLVYDGELLGTVSNTVNDAL